MGEEQATGSESRRRAAPMKPSTPRSEGPACPIKVPTCPIKVPTRRIEDPTRRIEGPTCPVEGPTCRIEGPTCRIEGPMPRIDRSKSPTGLSRPYGPSCLPSVHYHGTKATSVIYKGQEKSVP